MPRKFETKIVSDEHIESIHGEIDEIQTLAFKCDTDSLTKEDLFSISYRLTELARLKMDEADVLEEYN